MEAHFVSFHKVLKYYFKNPTRNESKGKKTLQNFLLVKDNAIKIA